MVRNLKKLYEVVTEQLRPFVQPELDWLTERYNIIKELDGETPVGGSLHQSHGREGLERINAISDVLMIHPYYICDKETIFDEKMRQDYIENVNMMCDFGKEAGKPMVVTEICWGALTDGDSVEAIKFTLDTLSQHNLGFVAHALHYSLVADLHYPEDGFLGYSHNLDFTTRNGLPRPGQEIFNQY